MNTIILIDGQNLYYNLKGMNILENTIKFDALFKSFLLPDDVLIRTYWFRPQKIHDSFYNAYSIRNKIAYKNYKIPNYKHTTDAGKNKYASEIEAEAQKVEGWIKKEKDRFSTIEYNYDKIALEFEDIEFVKTGMVKINPFDGKYTGEKGVDISLAVKMIKLSVEKRCNKIILVSGDYDYLEAIKYVKDNMTKINIVKLHKGVPPKNRSVSRELALLADKVIDVYESDLKAKFLKASPNP